MKKYFNVNIELDKIRVNHKINEALENDHKGYICAIESNNITVANSNPDFLKTVNSSLFNFCDGSVIALFISILYKKRVFAYTGYELMQDLIKRNRYKKYFLGNTPEILFGLEQELRKIDDSITSECFRSLPFLNVHEFDYSQIASEINQLAPDIICVSLGAPKQEIFMQKLLPYLNKGLLFGLGAAFNFSSNTGRIRRAPKIFLKLKLEWLYRAFQEPRKNIPRYWSFIKILPRLLFNEYNSKERREFLKKVKGPNE